MRMRPLLGLCAAFAAGILLAFYTSWTVWALALCGVALLGAGMARGRGTLLWCATLALTAWLGAARYTSALHVAADDASRLPSTSLTLRGIADEGIAIEEDPHTEEPATAKFVLDVTSARLDTDPGGRSSAGIPVSGRVAVRMTLRSRVTHASLPVDLAPHSGDTVELRGRLERPDGPRNPGGFDYRAYLARRGIYATLTVRQPEATRILSRASWHNPFLGLAGVLRQEILNACRHALPPPTDGVLAGILIGERNRIAQPIQEDFERTGTTHILATAGLHVGMVICLLTWLLRRCQVPRRPALAAAIVALALYSVMAGERAAVLRAAIVAGVYLLGELLEREPDLPNALGLAAFALLILNPLDLFDPGFQLSFATVITIVLLMPIFQRVLKSIGRSVRGETTPGGLLRVTWQGLVGFALLALAAQIGAGPLVAYYFYNVSFVSIAANALAVPAVFVVIALGFPMALLWTIHPVLAAPLAMLLRGVLSYILWVVHLSSEAPFASQNTAPPSPVWIAGFYVCVWSLAWYVRTRPQTGDNIKDTPKRKAVRRLAFAAGIVVLGLGLWGFVSPRPRELRVTFLDVGQGDACILELPGGKVIAVDTGGLLQEGEDDQGRRVVAPYLRYRGISRIDAIILSHPHADHIGGAASLLRRFATSSVMDDGQDYGSPLVPKYVGRAHAIGASIVVARGGQTLDFGDGVTAEVLGPSENLAGQGANNASVVLRVHYGRTAFLLTGDAEAPEEAEILSGAPDVACDVLKVGHHGSRTSSTPEFVAAAHPRYAVISVGKRNLYSHPSPEVVERLHESGAQVYRTDQDGAVICHSDGVSVHLEKMVNNQ